MKHPLLQAMVMMKWRTFQWIWLIELILQLSFTILMFRIGTCVLKVEPNNCGNLTDHDRQNMTDTINSQMEITVITKLAAILWIFYVLVEIVQFSFSIIEIVQNFKNWWKRVFGENDTKEQQTESKGQKRAKISQIIRNFYFPVPNYLKEQENWLQLLILAIR